MASRSTGQSEPARTPHTWCWLRHGPGSSGSLSVYDQPDAKSVHAQYDRVLNALAEKLPKVADHLEENRADVLAFTAFPKEIWRQLSPDLLGERGEREHVGPVLLEVVGDLGQFLGQRVQDPVVLRVNGFRVGLVVDRVQQRLDPRPGRLRAGAHPVSYTHLR